MLRIFVLMTLNRTILRVMFFFQELWKIKNQQRGVLVFPKSLQNFSERQILWSLCSVVFHALALKLPIQTSFSVAPKLPVSLRSGEDCPRFRKTSTPRITNV